MQECTLQKYMAANGIKKKDEAYATHICMLISTLSPYRDTQTGMLDHIINFDH